MLSSHLLRDVEAVCDEVLILKGAGWRPAATWPRSGSANRAFVELELLRAVRRLRRWAAALGCEVAAWAGGGSSW